MYTDKKQVLEKMESKDYSVYMLKELSPELLNDDEIISKAIELMKPNVEPTPLKYANPRFLENRDVVKRVVQKNPYTLESELKQYSEDKEMVLAGIEGNPEMGFESAGIGLKRDTEFIKDVIRKRGTCFKMDIR